MRDAKWFAVSVALAAGAMPMSAQTAAQPVLERCYDANASDANLDEPTLNSTNMTSDFFGLSAQPHRRCQRLRATAIRAQCAHRRIQRAQR
jgi:hypothetical protein